MIVDIQSAAGSHWHIEFDSLHPIRSLKHNIRVMRRLAAIRHEQIPKRLDHASQQFAHRHDRFIGPMI